MEPLPRLHTKISSLQELRDLVRALRALAASHVQEAHSALPGTRSYMGIVEDAIASGASLLPDGTAQPSDSRAFEAKALIVVCSEHGFVGAFNDRILNRAEAEKAADQDLMIVGHRGIALAEERDLKPRWRIPMATHVGGILGVARRMANELAVITAADAVFGCYAGVGEYNIEKKTVLPLDPALLNRGENGSLPLHHLPPQSLLERLADEYLLAETTRILTESLASENGARLRVMESADRNIRDGLDELKRQEHLLRGEITTSELLDIVTGSEAIVGGDRRLSDV